MNEYVDKAIDKMETIRRQSEKRRMSRIQNLNFLGRQATNIFYDDKRQSTMMLSQPRPTTVLDAPVDNEDLKMKSSRKKAKFAHDGSHSSRSETKADLQDYEVAKYLYNRVFVDKSKYESGDWNRGKKRSQKNKLDRTKSGVKSQSQLQLFI